MGEMLYGLPTLVIAVADNQVAIARSAHEHKFGIFIGVASCVNVEIIKDAFKIIIDNPILNLNMVNEGLNLVDAQGTQRVCNEITRRTYCRR